MRHSDLQKLYQTEYRIDPATGREKPVSRYVGLLYAIDREGQRRCAARAWLCLAVAAAAFAIAGLTPTWAGLCVYVAPWYIMCLLPLFYLLLAAVRITRMKAPVTQIDREEGPVSARRCGMGLAVLGGLWTLSDVVFLLLEGMPLLWMSEVVFLLCGAVTAAAGLVMSRQRVERVLHSA